MDNKEWFANKEVAFEIIKELRWKECAFKTVPQTEEEKSILIRWGKAFTLDYFNKLATRWGYWSRPMNLYRSLATYSHLPVLSFNIKERKAQKEKWNEECLNHIIRLDLGMDFDAQDIGVAYKHTKKIKKALDDFKVGYITKFSGSKGFHIVIPYQNMPKMKTILDQSDFHKQILETLHYEHKAKSLDLSVFDFKRLLKCSWSIDQKSSLVALPLTDEMFQKFRTSMCEPENVLNSFKIRDTHLFERGRDLPEEDKILNTIDWIEYITGQ